MNNILTGRGKLLLAFILFVIVCFVGYVIYGYYHQPQLVTMESQRLAEMPAGISLAAQNAKVAMIQGQLNDAAQQIIFLKNKTPETIVKTISYEVTSVVTKEVKNRGAEFAIVTNAKKPEKQVNLKEIENLPGDSQVVLNQYNVFAYKKIVRGVTIYPDWSAAIKRNIKINEVTDDISRKISNDGKYIAITAGYEFVNKRGKAGLRYSF